MTTLTPCITCGGLPVLQDGPPWCCWHECTQIEGMADYYIEITRDAKTKQEAIEDWNSVMETLKEVILAHHVNQKT